MKILLTILLCLTALAGCKSKDKNPDPPEVVCEAGYHKVGGVCIPDVKPPVVCPEGSVLNADGHCVVPAPVAEYCNPEGKQVECEAQFSMQPGSTKCRKFDGSDWAPSFFKDISEADSWGKANGFAFWINYHSADQQMIGDKSKWPWVCYPKK